MSKQPEVTAEEIAASFRSLADVAYDNWGYTADGSEEERRWDRMKRGFQAEALRWEGKS